MRQTDAHMGREAMGKWINIDDLPSGRVEWEDLFDAPSIDIVRCAECKHGEYREDFDDYECHSSGCGLVYDADFFCADGEVRDE